MTDPIDRERALYRYHLALRRGDFAAVAAILRRAESDPELARMVLELNAALEAEEAGSVPIAMQSLPRSTNGQRPPGAPIQEEHPMTFTTLASPARPARPVRRFQFAPSLTLIAALIAVALFGGLLLNQSGGLFASGGGDLPPNGGGDPLSAGAQEIVTATPSATLVSTRIPTATPIVVTATPGPMLVPDAQGPFTSTSIPWGPSLLGLVPSLPLDETLISTLLGNGDVGIFLFSAPQDGAYSLSVTALDFEPSLLVYTLDDPDLGIQRNTDEGPLPGVTLNLGAGDRVLVFVYSANREDSGEYLISVRAG